jgi:hypothetical protein
MRKFIAVPAFLLGLALPSLTHATCPNVRTTVTIPVTGAATIVPVNSATCMPLDATQFVAGIPGSALGATSKPAFTADGAGIHLTANGLATGAKTVITFTYIPNNDTFVVTALVGQVVTPIATTTTP